MSKLKTKKKVKKIKPATKKAAKKASSKKSLKTKKVSRVKKVVKTKKTVKAKKKAAPKKAKSKKAVVKKKVKLKTKKTVKVKVKKKAAPKKTVRVIRPVRTKKAVNAKDLFTAKELRDITKQLKELRVSLADIVKTKKELDLVEHDTGDVIDMASQSLDKEMFFELSGNELVMLEDVDAALRRIDNGVFGLCEYCRKPIKKLRIKAIPQARYCLACQSGNEQTSRI